VLDLIYEVFDPSLPRQGPGCEEATIRALEAMTGLPERPRILDIGCGTGAQTLTLARRTLAEIVAVDNHAPYLEALRARAAEAGMADRVTCVEADMARLDFEEGSFDALWSEGAIFVLGFEKGLRQWRPLLSARGYLAVTEATWLRADPSTEIRRFWEAEYPAITDVSTNLAVIEACGYRSIEHFALPVSAWWADFYLPLEDRVGALEAGYADNAEALGFLQSVRTEIEMYRRYSDEYGYVFYVLRRTD
jgi:SAM-dependent methyltransferase